MTVYYITGIMILLQLDYMFRNEQILHLLEG